MTAIFIVDAFADQPFKGNPAAVCLLKQEQDPLWMQQVAAEFNLSETAFIIDQGDTFGLRWFTPSVEVDLCGHATLASAHVLWEEGRMSKDQAIVFETKRYTLTCSWTPQGISMHFPAEESKPTKPPAGLLEALGVSQAQVERNRMDLLVILDSADTLRSLKPDHQKLAQIEARGIIATAPSDQPQWDCISRFFAIRVGVDEDPVTGSAHCCLAPYWSKRLGKQELVGYQASQRGGVVHMHLQNDGVTLKGKAVTVVTGLLQIA